MKRITTDAQLYTNRLEGLRECAETMVSQLDTELDEERFGFELDVITGIIDNLITLNEDTHAN